MSLLLKVFCHISVLFFLVACSNNAAIKTIMSGKEDGVRFVSTTAANNMSLLRNTESTEKACVRLGPDATFSDKFSSSVGFGKQSNGASSGLAESELVGRSIGIVGLRDIIFNLCLLNLNGIISDEEYAKQFVTVYSKGFDLLNNEVGNEMIVISEETAVNKSLNPVNSTASSGRAGPSSKGPNGTGTTSKIVCPDGVSRQSCG